MRSESCTFIWQPYVSMKYFRPFAFAFRFRFAFAFRPRPAGPQHLAGAGPNCRRYDVSADHPGEFLFPRRRRPGARPTVWRAALSDRLRDLEVGRAVRGDLRQVGDAQHLEPLRQPLQPAADHVGDCPADAGVDLVEDQGLAGRVGRGQRLERQHDARQLAARDDLAPAGGGPRRGSGEMKNSARSIPCGPTRPRDAAGVNRTSKRVRAIARSPSDFSSARRERSVAALRRRADSASASVR